jgi:hypothetical protein
MSSRIAAQRNRPNQIETMTILYLTLRTAATLCEHRLGSREQPETQYWPTFQGRLDTYRPMHVPPIGGIGFLPRSESVYFELKHCYTWLYCWILSSETNSPLCKRLLSLTRLRNAANRKMPEFNNKNHFYAA